MQIAVEDWCRIPKRHLQLLKRAKPADKTAWMEMIVPAGSHNDGLVGLPGDIWGISNDRVCLYAKHLKPCTD